MRKIVNSTFISLDGVTEHLEEWHFAYLDDSGTAFATEQILTCDAALMGRSTYEIYAASWPTQTGPYADRMNSIRKYVATTTLDRADWTNSTILDGDLIDAVTEIKGQPGGDILMNGVGPVARTLLRHGLLDRAAPLGPPGSRCDRDPPGPVVPSGRADAPAPHRYDRARRGHRRSLVRNRRPLTRHGWPGCRPWSRPATVLPSRFTRASFSRGSGTPPAP